MIFNQIAGGSSVKEPYIQWSVVDGELVNNSDHKIDLRNTYVLTIKPYQLYNLYKNNTVVSGEFDLGICVDIEESGMEGFLDGCVNIQSVNCNSIGQNSVKTKGLKRALARTGINEVSFDYLHTVEPFALQEICSGCGNLLIVKFPELSMVFNDSLGIYQYSGAIDALKQAFAGSSVAEIYFNKLPEPASTDMPSDVDGCFNSMLLGCSNTTVHFPKRLEQYVNTNIASLPNFSNGFDGINTTILFDRITKITRDNSLEYTLSQQATEWWNWYRETDRTWVYTSLNPSVGDNIYSDYRFTTVVGTIIAVA